MLEAIDNNWSTRELDRQISSLLYKREGDNPTIGLILCADKNDTLVKYTLLEGSKQIFASRYKLYLPSEEELRAELEREKAMLDLENKLKGKDD